MNTVKITKKDMYNSIKALCAGEEVDVDAILTFCDKEIAALDARALKAKEKAAEKRADGDELQALVLAALTEEPATRQVVFDRVVEAGNAPEDVSVAKIGYRLTALVKLGQAVKSDITAAGEDGKNHKYAAYALA